MKRWWGAMSAAALCFAAWVAVAADAPVVDINLVLNPEPYPVKFGVMYPQYAIWAQSADGTIVRTIFVTEKGAKDKWWFAKKRPSALPVWYGAREKEQAAGPLDVDAISGATPKTDQHILWTIPPELRGQPIDIFLEANISFQFNETYAEGIKRGQPHYNGVDGQPSLIWKATVAPDAANQDLTPELIGHGHVLGEDHAIDPDLSGITTAKDIFKSVRYRLLAAGAD